MIGLLRKIYKRLLGSTKKTLLIPPDCVFDFILEVAPKDSMYFADNSQYYYWGQWSFDSIDEVLDKLGKRNIRKILDLPCGHGRALRFLKAGFPEAALTACDITKDGVDFCVKTFGAKGVYSSEDPGEIDLDEKYDLIWCGSLLTHLDQDKWRAFLMFFGDHLEKNGVLVFTTHGELIVNSLRMGRQTLGLEARNVGKILREYHSHGFGYANYTGEEGYGISLSKNEWIQDILREFPKLSLVSKDPGKWGSKIYYQDVYAVVRSV